MALVIAWLAEDRIVANLLMVAILVSGMIAVKNTRQEIFPEISPDRVTVETHYRGSTPEEVEGAVCIPIEEALVGVQGIETIASRADPARCSVRVEVRSGYNVERVYDEIKESVGRIDSFPDAAEEPIVERVRSLFQVISVIVSADTDTATLVALGERVRDEVTSLPGVSLAKLQGVPAREIAIEVPEGALRRWKLTFDEIADAIRNFSLDLPGGSILADSREIFLRTKAQAYTGEEYGNVPLRSDSDGTKVYLRDVATIVDGLEEVGVSATLDGRPAVVVRVYRVGDQAAVDVSETVHAYVGSQASVLPEGVSITTSSDEAQQLRSRIDLLVSNGLEGLLLVFVVVALFLRLQLALWVVVGIPTAFLGGIAMMPLFGVSINMVSLFAFILVLGIVVDDAIVVSENIHAAQRRTGERLGGAIAGTREVLLPVVFGVLTTMAAFAPMLFLPGTAGKILVIIPLVALPVLFWSLIESNLILPSHLAHGADPARPETGRRISFAWNAIFNACSSGLDWFVPKVFRPVLRAAMEWRYLTVALALLSLLLAAGLVGSGMVRLIPFPTIEAGNVVAYLTMPRDATVEVTRKGADQIERAALELGEEVLAEHGRSQFTHVLKTVAEQPFKQAQSAPFPPLSLAQGNHLAEVNIELAPVGSRSVSSDEIANRWRERIGEVPGAVELVVSHGLVGNRGLEIEFSGTDIGTVLDAVEATKGRLAEYPGVVEISDSYRGQSSEIHLALTPEGESLGLTLRDLGTQVRQGFYGEEVQRVQRERDDIRVMLRYPRRSRGSLSDLEQMRIRTPSGHEVPFSTVASATMGRAPAAVSRVDRERVVTVFAGLNEAVTTSERVTRALRDKFLPELVRQHPGVEVSFEGDDAAFAEVMRALGRGLAIALLAMYAMLAIPLKSYSSPAIVLCAVPFGAVGAVGGHWLLGMDLSFLSMCGIVVLAGIVVNDALILVTGIARNSGGHESIGQTVQVTAERRFRAILLTSLTTVAGVTPLILEKSLDAQFLIPVAVSLAAGVLYSTAVTLVFVPALYMILEDLRGAGRWLAGRNRQQLWGRL